MPDGKDVSDNPVNLDEIHYYNKMHESHLRKLQIVYSEILVPADPTLTTPWELTQLKLTHSKLTEHRRELLRRYVLEPQNTARSSATACNGGFSGSGSGSGSGSDTTNFQGVRRLESGTKHGVRRLESDIWLQGGMQYYDCLMSRAASICRKSKVETKSFGLLESLIYEIGANDSYNAKIASQCAHFIFRHCLITVEKLNGTYKDSSTCQRLQKTHFKVELPKIIDVIVDRRASRLCTCSESLSGWGVNVHICCVCQETRQESGLVSRSGSVQLDVEFMTMVNLSLVRVQPALYMPSLVAALKVEMDPLEIDSVVAPLMRRYMLKVMESCPINKPPEHPFAIAITALKMALYTAHNSGKTCEDRSLPRIPTCLLELCNLHHFSADELEQWSGESGGVKNEQTESRPTHDPNHGVVLAPLSACQLGDNCGNRTGSCPCTMSFDGFLRSCTRLNVSLRITGRTVCEQCSECTRFSWGLGPLCIEPTMVTLETRLRYLKELVRSEYTEQLHTRANRHGAPRLQRNWKRKRPLEIECLIHPDSESRIHIDRRNQTSSLR